MTEEHRSILARIAAAIACVSLAVANVGCTRTDATVKAEATSGKQAGVIREDLSFPIDKGVDEIDIENIYGEINVRDRKVDEVGIHGVIQTLPPDFARAHVVSSREGSRLRVVVELPESATSGRYDMAAFVPAAMRLVLKGSRDRVDARHRSATLAISTTTGNIFASSQSRLELSTVSGTIRASALEDSWVGSSRISSDSGRIIVLAPLTGNLALSAETGGRLTTDFGLSVHPRAGGGFAAAARYGAGTSELRVESQSGEVILDQAVLLEEDKEQAEELD